LSRRARALSSRSFPWTDLDPDRRNAVLLVAGIGLVVVLSLGLVAYGYYKDKIAPKHETVLRVGHREFDYASVEKRLKVEYAASPPTNPQQIDAQQTILNTISKIEHEEIVRQAAKSQGVSATEDEIQARLAEALGLPKDTSREQIGGFLRAELVRNRMSLGEYREIVTADVLEKKLGSQFESIAPQRTEHVNLSLIETGSQVQALQAKQRLDSGEPFSVVATQVSKHESKSAAGDLGWRPRGSLDPKLEEFAFKQTGVSDVIETDDGFFILKVNGLETMEVTDAGKQLIVEFSVSNLLSKTKKDIGTERMLTAGQVQRLAGSLTGISRA
jgi:PPIC-type PPIASE domain/SurA-like N-terminal domain